MDATAVVTRDRTVVQVVAAGGQALLRTALCALLAGEKGLSVLGQTTDTEEVLELVADHGPDVVLLDVERADLGAVRTVVRLRTASPGVRVIVMTRCADPAFLRALSRAGAQRCLSQEVTYAVLVEAIRGEARDRSAVSPLLATLTPREAEIMEYVAQALSNRQIGRRLAITEDTVKRHLYNAFKKLGVASRLEAVNRLYGGRRLGGSPKAPSGAA